MRFRMTLRWIHNDRIVIFAWTIPLTSSISISCLFNQCLHAFSLSLSGVSVSMSSSRSVTPGQATSLAVLLPPSPLCILSLSVSCSFSGDSMVTVRDRLSRVGLPALWEISLTALSVAVVLSRCFRHFWSMFLSLSQRKTPPPGSSGVQHQGRQSRVLLPRETPLSAGHRGCPACFGSKTTQDWLDRPRWNALRINCACW